jgi:hypothetical protein
MAFWWLLQYWYCLPAFGIIQNWSKYKITVLLPTEFHFGRHFDVHFSTILIT